MVYNSRSLALLLAMCIALVTTLFLSLFDSVNFNALIVSFLICFSVSYLLTFVILEFLIFREIKEIYRLFDKLKKNELHLSNKSTKLNPLRNISEEIFFFADVKQKEIDELKKLEAFRREFIADVSHELKTPIFAAQGFVHTLLDGAVNDKTVRNKFLKKAARSLDGLDMLVQDLLVLSQIETGQIKMHFENVDMHQLTEEVFEQFENKADKKDVQLRVQTTSKRVVVHADRQRISQVMTNLISNAIKYSDDGTEVLVAFEIGKKNITVIVKDHGEGIPEEHLTRIFERFYRVDKSRSREKGGTGLGLAIVKHILEGHHSKADVESTPGKGSTFKFKLQRAKTEKSEQAEIRQESEIE